uniref:Neural cell adhesion molecule 2 n=1 Tax=Rhipicephalus appendiculatus TaxID=34631 RepID=A0A131YM86_RHIAP
MYVGKFHALLLWAALTVVTSYEEKDMRCRDYNRLVPSFKVCDGNFDCQERYNYHRSSDSEDEDNDLCAPQEIRTRTPEFTSLAHPNGSLLLSWTWSVPPNPDVAGYYLRGTSSDHTFQTTLSPLLSEYTADCLRGYTLYNITLRPFYGYSDLRPQLGKAVLLIVRSPATAPGAPKNILLHPQSGIEQGSVGEQNVTILEPVSWNSNPVGFRLRWEQNEELSEPVRDFYLPADMPGSKKDLDVKLPLKPGREYTLFASARGAGEFGEDLVGPETSVTLETTPVAPANLSAETTDPTRVIISWVAASPVRRFVILLSSYAPLQPPSQTTTPDYEQPYLPASDYPHGHDSEQDAVRGARLVTSSIVIDGSSEDSSSYRIPLFNLLPSVEYTVEVKACGTKACSSEATLLLTTPPSAIPTPDITKILSNDTSSLYLEWNFTLPLQTTDLSPEFEVRVERNGFYRLVHTLEKAITIGNLSSGTEYEVEVVLSLERTPGMREYGSPARATISTWPLVPLAPTLSTKGFETAPDVAVVSWTFLNSTVAYVEVATNHSSWVNCENSTECDVVVLHGWNSSYKEGFVRIPELKPYTTYSLSVKGCNDLGCGDYSTVVISTDISEPSEPTSLTVNATEDDSAYVEWKSPNEPGGPLTGYVVSWQCDQGHLMAATTVQSFLIIPGLPDAARECTFSVSAFNVADGGRQLRGKSASLTTPWPPQK